MNARVIRIRKEKFIQDHKAEIQDKEGFTRTLVEKAREECGYSKTTYWLDIRHSLTKDAMRMKILDFIPGKAA